jgi:hypothetical protein
MREFTLHSGSKLGWSPLPTLRHSVCYCPQYTKANLVSIVHYLSQGLLQVGPLVVSNEGSNVLKEDVRRFEIETDIKKFCRSQPL